MKVIRSSEPVLFFSKKEKEQIVSAIGQAEKKTSGEIRVHLERKAKSDLLAHARQVFERIGMAKTEQRNGVLIFLGIQTKRFAVIGDRGINEKVPDGFWEEIVQGMASRFRKDEFADGISEAILSVGDKLAEFFPYQVDDVNELPDEISFS